MSEYLITKSNSLISISTDKAAADPRIDALRDKIYCVEDPRFSVEYHEPSKRSIGNALLVELKDGTVLEEVVVEYPVGHKRRRAEGTPLLINKFKKCDCRFHVNIQILMIPCFHQAHLVPF